MLRYYLIFFLHLCVNISFSLLHTSLYYIRIIKSRRGNLFSNEQFIKNRTTTIYQISFVHIIMFFSVHPY